MKKSELFFYRDLATGLLGPADSRRTCRIHGEPRVVRFDKKLFWEFEDGLLMPLIGGGASGSAMTDFLSDSLLNEVFRNTNYAAVANQYCAMFSVAPTDAYTSGTPTGTEFSGNAYARQSVTFGAPTSPSSGRQVANSGTVTFPTATPSAQGTVVACGIFDALTTGNLLVWNTVGNKTISANDFYQLAIGNCACIFD